MYTRGVNIINFAPEFPPFTIVFQLVLALVRLIDWLYYRIRITGRENLRAAGALSLSAITPFCWTPAHSCGCSGRSPFRRAPARCARWTPRLASR
jgi:1-acyl-sn-glycerol-3-phosphate acyltransferase